MSKNPQNSILFYFSFRISYRPQNRFFFTLLFGYCSFEIKIEQIVYEIVTLQELWLLIWLNKCVFFFFSDLNTETERTIAA